MNTDPRILSSPLSATGAAPRPASTPPEANRGPRESFVPGTPDSPLGAGRPGAQPTTYPSGLQYLRDQSQLAFQAVLPAGPLLSAPLFIQSLNGQVTARAQNAPDQALPAQLCQDGKVYVSMQPNAPMAVFDPQTLEYGLSAPFQRDPTYGTTLREHAQLIGPDGSSRSLFQEAIGVYPGQHQVLEIRESPQGQVSAARLQGHGWQSLSVSGNSRQGYAVGGQVGPLRPFSAAASFAPVAEPVPPDQPASGMTPMEQVAAALNRGDLATVQRIMSQVPPPQPQQAPPQAPAQAPPPQAPPRPPSFTDGKTPEQVGRAFAALEGGYTAQHVARVTEYATSMAYIVGLPKERIEVLGQAADLFDVGKLEVPAAVLDKVGRYTDAEMAEMKKHVDPERLVPYMEMFGASEDVMAVVVTHHERPDGKGYPFGLKGDQIPFEASLIAVADAFDSMTQKRWSRLDRPDAPEALSPEKAMEILKKNAGTQFHPVAVEAMEKLLEFLKSKSQSQGETQADPATVANQFAALEGGYTALHSQRVTGHAVGIAAMLGLGEEAIKTLIAAGNVFDMGKLDVPAAVLDKTGKLSDEEFAEMKKHVDPQRMEKYFALFNVPEAAREAVLAHHERPDGRGYPLGTTEAPLLGRILAVADAYDAMTEKRWSRLDRPDAPEAMSPEKALQILKKNAGTQFDAGVVEAFEKVLASRGLAPAAGA